MLASAIPSLVQHVRRLAAASSSDEQFLADFIARRDAHAAEDCFQATFLVLAGRAAAVRQRASLAGFLHGVAYRLAVRARRRRVQSLPEAVCDSGVGPVEGLAWQEMLGILDQELGRL